MTELYRILEDFFDVVENNFRRPVKDMRPSQVIQTKEGYRIITNTLGIREDDITVDLSHDYILSIKGETELEHGFNNKVNLKFDLRTIGNAIKEIKYKSRDGLTYIDIILTEPASKVKITRAKD